MRSGAALEESGARRDGLVRDESKAAARGANAMRAMRRTARAKRSVMARATRRANQAAVTSATTNASGDARLWCGSIASAAAYQPTAAGGDRAEAGQKFTQASC